MPLLQWRECCVLCVDVYKFIHLDKVDEQSATDALPVLKRALPGAGVRAKRARQQYQEQVSRVGRKARNHLVAQLEILHSNVLGTTWPPGPTAHLGSKQPQAARLLMLL